MKILQVHNFYRQPGGEDVVASQERRVLRAKHTIDRWTRDNTRELEKIRNRLTLPFTTHYSTRSKKQALEKLAHNQYDLMHVHNFFPLFTPSIFDAARERGVPSVLTLHNYRLVHPNGLLFHKGRIDERSVKGSAWKCVKDGVYRDSMLQTAVVAHMIEYHRKRGTWKRVPTLFIALTNFAKRKLSEGGLPEERIFVKPNFIKDPGPEPSARRAGIFERAAASGDSRKAGETGAGTDLQDYFLFAGRVSREKGVKDLIDTWIKHDLKPELRIVGDGPEKPELETSSAGNPRIRWMGRLDREEVLRQMEGARAVLLPSRWYEGFPMTLVEAFSVGCPAIVTNIGSQAEIVEPGRNGLQFSPGNHRELAGAVESLSGKVEEITGAGDIPTASGAAPGSVRNPAAPNELARILSEGARRSYLESYTPEANYKKLMEIYERAIVLERELAAGKA